MHNQTVNPLFQVVTIQEAASLYYVSTGTIRYHMDKGRLTCRKAGLSGLYLITLDSLIRLYGPPKKTLLTGYLQSNLETGYSDLTV